MLLPAGSFASDLAGRYFPVGLDSPNAALEVSGRQNPACTLTWQPALGRRLRGLGLRDGDDLLAASVNLGSAAYGVISLRRSDAGWRGRWITSIDGGGAVGEMTIEGAALPGRHRFVGRGRSGVFDGGVTVTARGPAFLLNFNSSTGMALYRGVGAVRGDRLAVAWSFGGAPALALYDVDAKGLTGARYTLPRGGGEAAMVKERFAREGAEDTIFPPLLPNSASP